MQLSQPPSFTISTTALLHDIDDRKLTKRIVPAGPKSCGRFRLLLEVGMIDAITGIERCIEYSKSQGRPFHDDQARKVYTKSGLREVAIVERYDDSDSGDLYKSPLSDVSFPSSEKKRRTAYYFARVARQLLFTNTILE